MDDFLDVGVVLGGEQLGAQLVACLTQDEDCDCCSYNEKLHLLKILLYPAHVLLIVHLVLRIDIPGPLRIECKISGCLAAPESKLTRLIQGRLRIPPRLHRVILLGIGRADLRMIRNIESLARHSTRVLRLTRLVLLNSRHDQRHEVGGAR